MAMKFMDHCRVPRTKSARTEIEEKYDFCPGCHKSKVRFDRCPNCGK